MDDTPYTNRELDLKLNGIFDKCDAILKVATEGRDQAIKTNGRVNALEKINENRRGVNKVLTFITIPIFGVLIGFLSWVGIALANIDHKIQVGIAGELSKYEIRIEP